MNECPKQHANPDTLQEEYAKAIVYKKKPTCLISKGCTIVSSNPIKALEKDKGKQITGSDPSFPFFANCHDFRNVTYYGEQNTSMQEKRRIK